MKHAYLLYTGFGKTKMCLDEIVSKNIKRTLLISTKKIVEGSWIAEIKKWNFNLSYAYITGDVPVKRRKEILQEQNNILGLSTEMLDWYIKETTSVQKVVHTKQGDKVHYNFDEQIDLYDLIIIDEVSLFKNYKSKRFSLLKKWCHKITNVMLLSATPTPKNIEDLWSIIYLIDSGVRLGKNITAFRNTYGIPVPLPNGYNRYYYTQEATDEVLKLVTDITTSVPAPPQPLFPEPIIKKTIIKPDNDTAQMLKEFKDEFILRLGHTNIVTFSRQQLITKVNQVASGHVYHRDTTIRLHDIKFRALKRLLSTIITPVLITYVFKEDKRLLLSELPDAVLINTPEQVEDWNNNKIKIGIVSPFSTSHGLNMQDSECRDIIWYSPIWDTEKWIQLNARVCRRGLKHLVTIRVLLLQGSYDEYAFEVCQEKFQIQYNNLTKLQRGIK
jgi:hypothetical protein